MSFKADGAERESKVNPPEQLLHGRFEVVKVLAGGMGIVYLCRDTEDGSPVALKTFKPEFLPSRDARDRFLREGATWVSLGRHPHIVHCRQVFSPGVELEVYLALEWIAHAEGKRDASLRAWLRPGEPLPLKKALVFALHISRGMRYAATKIPGLVHRDLKPENVLVGRDGLARVTDFGLASILGQLEREDLKAPNGEVAFNRPQLTRGIVGTPLYMAPEQWRTEGVLDTRADIYAFGCILYEMITGRTAVSGNNLAELERAHRMGRLNDIPSEVPTKLATLLCGCLATRPGRRYRTWGQVEDSLVLAYESVTGAKAPDEVAAEGETRLDRIMEGWSYHAIGHSYHELGKYDTAMMYFDRVRQIGNDEGNDRLKAAGLHSLGAVHAAVGDPRQAIELYQEALRSGQGTDSLGARTLASLANAYRDLGEMQRAIDHYQQAVSYYQAAGDRRLEGSVLTSLGNAYRRLGRVQDAVELYQKALAIAREFGARGSEGTVLGNLGIAHRNLGDPERAIEFQRRALDIARGTGDLAREGAALNNLGLAHSDLGHICRAVDLFEQALAVARETGQKSFEATVQMNLANSLRDLGQTNRAIDLSTNALASAEETGDILGIARCNLSLAMSMVKAGLSNKALEHAQVAAQTFKDYGHAQFAEAARDLIEQVKAQSRATDGCRQASLDPSHGRLSAAIRESRAALDIDPDNATAHYHLGMAYANQGRMEDAIMSLTRALDIRPRFASAHTLLGVVYQELGRLDDAVREWQASLRIAPDDEEVRYSLALVYERQGRRDKAIEEHQAVLRANPEHVEARYHLGVAYSEIGRLREALSQLQGVLRRDPSHANAHTSRGIIYMRQSRVGDAMSEFQTALDINPDDADAHYNLGGAYSLQGQWGQALRHYKAALQTRPDDADAHYNLGVTYYNQGRMSEALNELQIAAQLGSQDAWRLLAQMGLF